MIITQTFTTARWQTVVRKSEATKQTKDLKQPQFLFLFVFCPRVTLCGRQDFKIQTLTCCLVCAGAFCLFVCLFVCLLFFVFVFCLFVLGVFVWFGLVGYFLFGCVLILFGIYVVICGGGRWEWVFVC